MNAMDRDVREQIEELKAIAIQRFKNFGLVVAFAVTVLCVTILSNWLVIQSPILTYGLSFFTGALVVLLICKDCVAHIKGFFSR